MTPVRMTARYSGTCANCKQRVAAGSPIFWAGKGRVAHEACVDRQAGNPWKAQHVERESAYHEGGRRARWAMAQYVTDMEYADAPDPMPCVGRDDQTPCDATMWWRSTVGVMQCPSCGTMADSNGGRYDR